MDGVTSGTVAVALDAWTTVGSFVVLSLVVVRLVARAVDEERLRDLSGRPVAAPVGGALLGAIPGCGGAIAVVSLYGHGTVGFGTLVAALVATAGDSAFVLLAAAPRTAALTYGVAVLSAVLAGAAVTAAGLDGHLDRFGRGATGAVADGGALAPTAGGRAVGRPGDADGGVPASVGLVAWWLAALAGVGAGLHRAVTGTLPTPVAGGGTVTLPVVAAVVGVGLSALLYALPDGWRRTLPHDGVGGIAAETAAEASRVVVWVVVALGAFRLATATGVVGPVAAGAGGGVPAAVGGALLGAVPGCGVHVALVTAHTEGAVPLAALVANAISQDGDALFALVAVDRVAAVVATAYTTAVAAAVGLVVVAL
jgi:hypothetical protein